MLFSAAVSGRRWFVIFQTLKMLGIHIEHWKAQTQIVECSMMRGRFPHMSSPLLVDRWSICQIQILVHHQPQSHSETWLRFLVDVPKLDPLPCFLEAWQPLIHRNGNFWVFAFIFATTDSDSWCVLLDCSSKNSFYRFYEPVWGNFVFWIEVGTVVCTNLKLEVEEEGRFLRRTSKQDFIGHSASVRVL